LPAERLEREQRKRGRSKSLAERLDEIALRCASLPTYDSRSPDDIIGYDGTACRADGADTSAIVAILLDEPERHRFIRLIEVAADRRYDKGRHPAGLNFGDVFAYALANAT
jgi:hypothetical protein